MPSEVEAHDPPGLSESLEEGPVKGDVSGEAVCEYDRLPLLRPYIYVVELDPRGWLEEALLNTAHGLSSPAHEPLRRSRS